MGQSVKKIDQKSNSVPVIEVEVGHGKNKKWITNEEYLKKIENDNRENKV